MQHINELQTTQTEEELIEFFDKMSVRLKSNGDEVRDALSILKSELIEKQNAARRD